LPPPLQAVQARTAVRHVLVMSIGEMKGAALFVAGDLVSDGTVRHAPVSLGDAIARGAEAGFTPVRISADDVAVLQYTGGATGVSKGATLLHRNLVANIVQSEVWREPVYRNRTDIGQYITAVALPLYHIFGLTICALLTMRCSGIGILIPDPRDISGMI
jgi:long-chain acyl-CoA synthetase